MSDDLRIALSIARITEATREPGDDYGSQFGSLKPRALADALLTLAAEVRRYRAAVEEVKTLEPALTCYVCRAACGPTLGRDEAPAILEGKK